MNLAIVQHMEVGAMDKKYAFLLPDNAMIGSGTFLLLDTRHGYRTGILVDRVEADGPALDYILRGLGTDKEHLRPVKGILVSKTFDEIKSENIDFGRYDVGGDAYLRVCRERNEAERNYRETCEKLIEVETERDMLKAKLNRILKCCGVGE